MYCPGRRAAGWACSGCPVREFDEAVAALPDWPDRAAPDRPGRVLMFTSGQLLTLPPTGTVTPVVSMSFARDLRFNAAVLRALADELRNPGAREQEWIVRDVEIVTERVRRMLS